MPLRRIDLGSLTLLLSLGLALSFPVFEGEGFAGALIPDDANFMRIDGFAETEGQ